MTFDPSDVFRVISKLQVARLQELGATVTKDHVTATEEQLWRAGPSIRHELLRAGLLTIGSNGGGGGYVAKAVQIVGPDVSLRCAALSSGTDNGKFYYSIWYKQAAFQTGTAVLLVCDPSKDYAVDTDLRRDGGAVADCHSSSELGSLGFVVGNEAIDTPGVYHHILASYQTDKPAGEKIAAIYLDDVPWPVDPIDVPQDADNSFVMPFNGRELYLFDDGFSDGVTGIFADYRVGIGAGLHDPDGTIPEVTRRLFITADLKPVDPATATATLGAPTGLFSGDADTFGTNQGTGGDFAWTGTPTTAAGPTVAGVA